MIFWRSSLDEEGCTNLGEGKCSKDQIEGPSHDNCNSNLSAKGSTRVGIRPPPSVRTDLRFSPLCDPVPFTSLELDMSSSVSRDTDASHSRGRKRSHAEEEKSETSSKRSKLTTDSTVHSQNGRRDKDDEGPRRALTPEELAHEKDIKERSKKYQRTVANKTKVRPSNPCHIVALFDKNPILTESTGLKDQGQALEAHHHKTRSQVPSGR